MRKIEIITTFKTVSDFPSYRLGHVAYQCRNCDFATLVPDDAWRHAKEWPNHLLSETLTESEDRIVVPDGRVPVDVPDEYCSSGCGQFSHHPPTGECPKEGEVADA